MLNIFDRVKFERLEIIDWFLISKGLRTGHAGPSGRDGVYEQIACWHCEQKC